MREKVDISSKTIYTDYDGIWVILSVSVQREIKVVFYAPRPFRLRVSSHFLFWSPCISFSPSHSILEPIEVHIKPVSSLIGYTLYFYFCLFSFILFVYIKYLLSSRISWFVSYSVDSRATFYSSYGHHSRRLYCVL